jgi:hypothetical protein
MIQIAKAGLYSLDSTVKDNLIQDKLEPTWPMKNGLSAKVLNLLFL